MSEALNLDYHYGVEAERYSFYRTPKMLFTDQRFKNVSAEAKTLYGIMLDRMGLSIKNKWLDESNRIYIFFTLEDAMELMGCGHNKVVSMLAQLDTVKGVGLIERRKQGQGKPTKIYVKNFNTIAVHGGNEVDQEIKSIVYEEIQNSEKRKSGTADISQSGQKTSDLESFSTFKNWNNVLTSENRKSGFLKNGSQDFPKSETNNTKLNNTDLNDIELSIHLPEKCKEEEVIIEIDTIDAYREIIKDNIDYDILLHDNPCQIEQIDELVELMLEMVCETNKEVRIGQQSFPTDMVKSRLLKFDKNHLEYVMDCISKNTTKVHNIKAYMMKTLYNAPATMSNFYRTRVNHDMYGGGTTWDR